MIREALDWLKERVDKSQTPIEVSKRDDRVIYLYPDGREVTVAIDPKRRFHNVHTVDDFVAACSRWGTSGGGGVVFHDEKRVVLLCDDDDRRDVVVLPLLRTDVVKVFERLDAEPQAFDQRTFLRLLRRDLRNTIPAVLITAISNIEIVSAGNGKSEINPGRERGTREFAADLASEKIPDVVTCNVPLYQVRDLDTPWPIVCHLEYTLPPRPIEFVFRPMADEVAKAFRKSQEMLHELLCDLLSEADGCSEITVLYGEP